MKKVGWSSILVAAMLLADAVIAEAQQLARIPRIGYLATVSRSAIAVRIEAFRQGLRELGYVEGKTLSLSGDLRRENSIAFPRSRPSWCVSR